MKRDWTDWRWELTSAGRNIYAFYCAIMVLLYGIPMAIRGSLWYQDYQERRYMKKWAKNRTDKLESSPYGPEVIE